MKKILFIITLIIILTGCNNQTYTYQEINLDETIKIDNYIDDNPITVSLYQGNKKITKYHTTLGNFKEIGVFNVYYTNKDILDSYNIKQNFLKYYNEYQNITNYKTGFYISFYVNDKLIEKLILDPTTMHSMEPYMYVYLYDDINQTPGTFYSHLEPDDMKKNTIISSIKLFFPQNGLAITSPIKLTVFTYNDKSDFTKDNYYRGKSSYTIEIETN